MANKSKRKRQSTPSAPAAPSFSQQQREIVAVAIHENKIAAVQAAIDSMRLSLDEMEVYTNAQ